MRTILAVTLLVLAGCASPEYTAPSWGGSGEPWDTTWLIGADVSSVDLLGVAATLETHYWDFAQADGVCVEPRRSDVALADPDGWDTETNEDRRAEVEDFVGDLWDNTSEHQSAWFAAVRGALSDEDVTSALTASLKSLGLKPLRNYSSPYRGQQFSPSVFEVLFGLEAKYVLPPHLRKPTGYFTWQKMPWDVQDAEVVVKEPQQDAVGLGFLLPYWMARYFGAL